MSKTHWSEHRVGRAFCLPVLSISALVGCGSTVKPVYSPDFAPVPGTKVQLAAVTDAAPVDNRGDKAELDISGEMRGQLERHLATAGLLTAPSPTEPYVRLTVTIHNYEPGNAFARWLLPGLGPTKLSIECKLFERGAEVGTITVERHVSAGGGYTIGQWKTIFKDTANDVVKELKKKLPKA